MPLKIGKDKARAIDRLLQQSGGGSSSDPSRPYAFRNDPLAPTIFQNDSGEIVPAYAIMQPKGTTDQGGRPVVTIDKWDGQYIGPFLFNAHNPVAIDANGTAQPVGLTRVIYNQGYTPTFGKTAGPVSSEWYIDNVFHAGIVYGALDEENRVALIIPQMPQSVRVRAPSGGIPARVGNLDGHATCDVWSKAGSSYGWSDTGINIDVLNWGVEVACATGDRYGWAAWYDGAWCLISEDCADEPVQAILSISGSAPNEEEEGNSEEMSGAALQIVAMPALDEEFEDFQATSGGLPPTLP